MTTRVYNVHILAEDEKGKPVSFDEKVILQGESSFPEKVREERGFWQVCNRMPNLKNVRTNGSVHAD